MRGVCVYAKRLPFVVLLALVAAVSFSGTLHAALNTAVITTGNAILDNGQSNTIVVVWTRGGGTRGPYTVNLITSNTVSTCTTSGTVLQTHIVPDGTTTNNFVIAPSNSAFFCSQVTANNANRYTNVIYLTVNPALTTPTLTISNTIVDAGQFYETLAATQSGGTTPYTYNFRVYNSITNTVIASQSASANTYTFLVPAYWTSNSLFYANVIVTDSASTPVSVNSILTAKVTVNGQMVTPTITVSNAIVDADQSYESFRAYESGGSSPITYNFLVYNSITNTVIGNYLATSNTYAFQVPPYWTSNSLFYANVVVTDALGLSFNSILSSKVTVNSALNIPAPPTRNHDVFDVGQTVTFNAFTSGGTAPYTYNFIIADNVLYQDQAASGWISSNSWAVGLALIGGFVSNVVVRDSASTPIMVNSIFSSEFRFNPAMTLGKPGLSANTLDYGQSVTITEPISGGTTPYTFNFIIANAINASVVACSGPVASINAFVYTPSCLGTLYANVVVTDSADVPVTKNSVNSDTFVVNPVLSTPTKPTINDTALSIGQNVLISTFETGGSTPYTYNFIISNSTTNAVVASSGPQAGNSFKYTTTAGGTYYANVIIRDSATIPVTVNSIYSATFAVANASLNPLPPILNATLLDSGQKVSLVTAITGGIAPYTYNFIISDSATNSVVSSSGPQASNSFAYTTGTTGIYHANVIVVDSVPSTDVSHYSNIFAVNSVLASPQEPSLNTTSTNVDSGVNITTYESGGTLPYSYNFIISNITDNAIVGYSGPQTANYFNYYPMIPGNFQANVVVTDFATNPESDNSIYSVKFYVADSLHTPQAPQFQGDRFDEGQTINMATLTAGGTTPYTYNFIISAASTGAVVASSGPQASNSFSYLTSSIGALRANVVVSDSGGITKNSVYSGIFGVNSALVAPTTPVADRQTVDIGQTRTVSTYVTGGTAPYTYNFIIYNGTIRYSGSTSSNSFTYAPDNVGLENVNVVVTDSASTQVTLASASHISVTNNPPLNISKPYPAATSLDVGQSVDITVPITGGTTPYTFNFVVYNAITQAIVNSSRSISVNNYYFYPKSTGIFFSNVLVTDNASLPVSVWSSNSINFTAYPSMEVSAPSANVSSIYQGNVISISALATGGKPPYTYNFQIANAIDGSVITTSGSLSSNTFNYTASTAGTFYANVVVTDAVSASANSVDSSNFTVLPAPPAPTTTTTTIPFVVPSGGGLPGTTAITTAETTSTVAPTTTIPQRVGTEINASENVTSKACGGASDSFGFHYSTMQSTFTVNPSGQVCFGVSATNMTGSNTIPEQHNLTRIILANITLNTTNATMYAEMHYPCDIGPSQVAPFILLNGTWTAITPFSVNSTSCTVSFEVPSDPIVGLFKVTGQATSTIETTIPAPTTSISGAGGAAGGGIAIVAAIVIIAALAGAYWYFATHRRKGFRR